MKTAFTFLMLLCLMHGQALLAFADVTITGTVKMIDGSPPRDAQVSFTSYNPSPEEKNRFVTVIDGKFSVSAPKVGVYRLSVSAPNAQRIDLPVIISEGDQSLKVNLALISVFPDDIQSVKVIVDGQTSDMTKEADGSYSFIATATADTLAYQLVLNQRGHTHNGTQSDYFIYDGGGDFYSVLRVKAGSQVKIIFEPKKVLRSPEDSQPKVQWEHPLMAKLSELQMRCKQASQTAIKSFTQAQESGQPFTGYDYGLLPKELEAITNNASEKLELRQFAALTLLGLPFIKHEQNFTSSLLSLVPPNSPMWALEPNLPIRLLQRLYDKDLKKIAELLELFVRQNPDRKVHAIALSTICEIADFNNDKEKTRALYNELKTKFSDIPEVQFTLSQLNPDKAIQAGNPVPDFEVKLLSGETVSRTSLLGKFYLIDFWGVWCGPCVEEMPKLHEAYEKYKGKKGFEVLSFSFDRSPDDIEKFRATKFPMPWLHALIEKGFRSDLATRFEVLGIPKPILVDDKGTIVATEMELRGENLDKTLSKHLDILK